jgi:hypothetical protein
MKKKILKQLRDQAKKMPVPESNDVKKGQQVVTWKANYRQLKKDYKRSKILPTINE